MDSGESFFSLRRFVKGKIDKYELMDTDNSIERVDTVGDNRSLSKIYLDMGDMEKFGKLLNLSDDDIWFYRAINSNYSSYDIYDDSNTEEDFFHGSGPWYYINQDNLELFDKIHKYITGKPIDTSDYDSMGAFAKKLDKSFQREIGNIISEWTYEKNREFVQVASESVDNEIKEFLTQFGFEMYGDDGLKTTVADLIALYHQYDAFHLSIYNLLKYVFKNADNNLGGWDEDRYEYYDDKVFDKDGFNWEVQKSFESILEKFEDEPDAQAYIRMIDRVTTKFSQNIWHDLPKDRNFVFRIVNFEKEGNKISIQLKKKGGVTKQFKVSEEGLNRLLYYPELFNLEDI